MLFDWVVLVVQEQLALEGKGMEASEIVVLARVVLNGRKLKINISINHGGY